MTRQKSFKRLVRARMEKTGESYTAARASLLAADEPKATEGPTLTMSDDAIRQAHRPRLGALVRPARRLGRHASARTPSSPAGCAEEQGTGGWNAQAIVGLLRARPRPARRRRARRRLHRDGLKTVAVPVDRLYEAFVDEPLRRAGCPTPSCASAPPPGRRSARFDWGDDGTRVVVGFEAKADGQAAPVAWRTRSCPTPARPSA